MKATLVLACVFLTGCATFEPGIDQARLKELAQKCEEDPPKLTDDMNGDEGLFLTWIAKWREQTKTCALNHNGLVDILIRNDVIKRGD